MPPEHVGRRPPSALLIFINPAGDTKNCTAVLYLTFILMNSVSKTGSSHYDFEVVDRARFRDLLLHELNCR